MSNVLHPFAFFLLPLPLKIFFLRFFGWFRAVSNVSQLFVVQSSHEPSSLRGKTPEEEGRSSCIRPSIRRASHAPYLLARSVRSNID